MNRSQAYAIAVHELVALQARGYAQLRLLIESSPSEKQIVADGEIVIVTTTIRWAKSEGGPIAVEVSVDGPSCWRLEKLVESIMLPPPA